MAFSSARIVVNLIQYSYKNELVQNYAQSVVREIEKLGHKVTSIGPGTNTDLNYFNFDNYDLLIDLDCGRDSNTGKLNFWFQEDGLKTCPILSSVWFIDSHGNPSLHKRISKQYDHVFFAVWDKRDLFVKHKSAYWLPNATDSKWFNSSFVNALPKYDFGFFGSKMGLVRADPMKEICDKHNWSHDIREIGKVYKQRWPRTAEAMGDCAILFNHGQKHDGPNLRVMESMAMGIPLINDQDDRSGMDQLFTADEHYISYEHHSYQGLEEAMNWTIKNYNSAVRMAEEAMSIVNSKHLIKHRVKEILEVSLGTS